MRFLIVLVAGLAMSTTAGALTSATYTEQLEGSCTNPESLFGVDDLVPEALGLDQTFNNVSGACQLVGSLALVGSTRPAIDLQMSGSALSVSANLVAAGSGVGAISYYFQVTGPEDQLVDIVVSAFASISGSRSGETSVDYAFGSAAISGLPGGENIGICSYFGPRPGSCPDGPEGNVEATLQYNTQVITNVPYLIYMQGGGRISAIGGLNTTTQSEIQVIVDPTFSFLNAGDDELYDLEFSPNMTVVPLPATAALLPAGLLACAGRLRRRRA